MRQGKEIPLSRSLRLLASHTGPSWTAPGRGLCSTSRGWRRHDHPVKCMVVSGKDGLHDGSLPEGAVAILGDAAHPTLPFLAQGASMGLEDAWVLAASLAGHDSWGAGLQAYQAARAGRCARIVEAASRNARAYHLRGVTRAVAHAGLRLGGWIAPDLALRRFDWLYGFDATK